MSTVDVTVPDMGNFDSVSVIEGLVKPGDVIDIETPLVTLETDKATMDVPSTAKGVVEKVHVTKGGSVAAGARVAPDSRVVDAGEMRGEVDLLRHGGVPQTVA